MAKTQQNMTKIQQNMEKTQQKLIKSQKTQQELIKSQQELIKSQQELIKSQQELIKSQQELIKSQKTQQELIKSQQELIKSQQELIKSQQELIKSQQELIKSQKTQQNLIKSQQKSLNLGKRKNTQNLPYEKPSKLAKRENLTSQKQQIMSKNKKRIETARKKLKELRHKLSKSDLKIIKEHLYNIERKKELLESKIIKEHFDELDKKFLEFDEYYNDNDDDDYDDNDDDDDDDFIGIENVQDLFKISIYKPTIVKSGYNNNYNEHRSKGDKLLTMEEYLNLIKPYLRELINDHKNKGEWKIQLTAQINFISLRPGSNETRVMDTRSVNEEFMIGSDTDKIIKELFRSLLQRYQENLQEKMKGSDFAFDGVNYLYYDLNKISISKGGSYIDSPKWLKDKKSTINPKNNDYKCFQYAVTLALNLDKINKNSQRISKVKAFIEEYNWKDIDFPSASKDWKKFE